MRDINSIELKPKQTALEKHASARTFTGRDEQMQQVIAMRNSAKHELLQTAPLFVGTFATNLSLQKALRRNVKVKIIVERITPKNRTNITNHLKHGAEIRLYDKLDGLSMLINDSSELLFGVHDYHNQEDRLNVYTRNQALVSTMRSTFLRLWKDAKPVNLRR
jgi:phosphatidylserine/phosphatidylglycerophosphate/cardiolipin synthase-like enzyme